MNEHEPSTQDLITEAKDMEKRLFKTAENESAYLKGGILGFAGSGKSYTAMRIAVGLHKFIESKKPIYYLDTETGSDFLLSHFQKNKIELLVCKSRAFIDLLGAVGEAEEKTDILIIDSITHFWTELLQAYQQKKKIARLTLHHWMPIKQEWRQFTDKYINSQLHIIMCGRAGWEFDYIEDNEGVKELAKTGTRMKAESEMGYEPSLLIEMEKVRTEVGKIGGNFLHRAWILKDRFDVINGKFFDDPDFDVFLPHIELLNIGKEHVGTDTKQDSQKLFNSDKSISLLHKQRDILLEEITAELTLKFNQTSESKKSKINFLRDIFKSGSWTYIANLPNEKLEEGLKKLKELKKNA